MTSTALAYDIFNREFTPITNLESTRERKTQQPILITNPPSTRRTDNNSSSIIFPVDSVLRSLFEAGIHINNVKEVRDFLLSNFGMEDIVLEISEAAYERFCGKVKLELEVYHDPEIEDELLVLYIRQEEYDENIMEVIEDIRQDFDEELSLLPGFFHITTDFK